MNFCVYKIWVNRNMVRHAIHNTDLKTKKKGQGLRYGGKSVTGVEMHNKI